MRPTPQHILKQFWGFDTFREKQLEIIEQPLAGKDVLALLPTGGGKSICFQVPALCMPGICVVVSPLIALIKDQVENLKKKGVNAVSLHSGMHHAQIDATLDNCVYGDVKFLYLSPERLRNEMVRVRLQKMKVNLIAVDEAHCISQWGYDFRPSYLHIANIRELLPDVPVMALTATATLNVTDDIQERLLFKQKNVIRKSFHRPNLSYMVLYEQDVKGRLLRILSRTQGSGIVYVRSRRKTQEMARFLHSQDVRATYYHAGLSMEQRQQRQQDWVEGRTRIIVATNAFGMGIDKPDVRLVVHLGFPDNLEAYFQEAGRAGRDEKEAFCVALVNNGTVSELRKRAEAEFPSRQRIKDIYHALGSTLQLAEGSGADEWYDLDLEALHARYDMTPKEVLTAISFLEKADHLILSADFDSRSTVRFLIDNRSLYDLQLRNPKVNRLIKVLLRSYGRLFDEPVSISEALLAKRSGYTSEQVAAILKKLHELHVVDYRQATGLPKVSFIGGRLRKQDIHIPKAIYEDRIALIRQRVNAAARFIETDKICRSQMLLSYFGETESTHCGKCDVCRKLSNTTEIGPGPEQLKAQLSEPIGIDELVARFPDHTERSVLKTVQMLLDDLELQYHLDGKLSLS